MPGSKPRFAARASVLLAVLGLATQPGLAQRPVQESLTATSGYVSASGAVAYGFTHDGAAVDPPAGFDISAVLPGSDFPGATRRLLERMWRGSATFRRQCARLADARAAVAIDFHHSRQANTDAETVVTQRGGLRATIHLRADDVDLVMHLAHEVEHVLEQIDHVDLALAVASRVHGARATRQGEAFETSRAIAVGRLVAREVETATQGR